MAISYPRSLPSCGLRSALLDLEENVAVSPSGRGLVLNRTQVADPVWIGTFETEVLRQAPRADWGAWLVSLRGGLRTFLAFDSRRRAPLAYARARAPDDIAGGWDGTGAVADLGSAGVLTLSDLPAQYQVTVGDRIGIEQGGRFGYYEAIEDAGADAGGNVVVTVAPFLHTAIFSPGAVARLWRPVCEMVIDTQSRRGEPGSLPRLGSFNFSAWQKI